MFQAFKEVWESNRTIVFLYKDALELIFNFYFFVLHTNYVQ